jgi:hypothetical protein
LVSNAVGPSATFSALLRQVPRLDTNIQECVGEWIKSAEFGSIDDIVAQLAFFRTEIRVITYEIISVLSQLPKSTLHGWLRRREKEMDDDPSLDLANPDLSRPNSWLTITEEDYVSQWIWDSHCEKRARHPPKDAILHTIFGKCG